MNDSLPVHRHAAEIVAAIKAHQVVVLTGPTGSGKTTQLPQLLLAAGITDRRIGVTQPRRIAAVSVAGRIAQEQGVELGREVGYSIRFDDRTSPGTRVQVMTDGILLQIARTTPLFDEFGVIVVDEAHERTLNVDFVLGLLHEALLERADLRVVVSSATLRPETFVEFFQDVGVVPIVSVDARPHPVDVVWRSLQYGGIDDLVDTVAREVAGIHRRKEMGHVLVFLSGEDGIKRCGEALAQCNLGNDLVVLPLYGALTREQQERVFADLPGKRKVVLATNIAETSITIDGVRFVIDSGLAKVPRFSARTGIQALREEGISQASADQRAGRAGRTAPGTCIRLYSQQSYRSRPMFLDEEILRLDLAEVVLRMLDLGIRDVEGFPLPTLPPRGRVRAALEALEGLHAIDRARHLTAVGRRMVPFPLSPSLARMVVEAAERFPDVVDEVLAYAAWLGTRSPLLFPDGAESRARAAHQSFAHPLGDAVTAVRILQAYHEADDKPGFCKRNFLDHHGLQFVVSAWSQLRYIAGVLGVVVHSGGNPEGIVRCVAQGFAPWILRAHGRAYEGPGDDKIFLHPGSNLADACPRFVVAAELVVTQRPYARQVSALRPAWVVEARPDLAQAWHLDRERVQRQEGQAPVVPEHLDLDGIRLAVDARKGKGRVELGWREVLALRALPDPPTVPDSARRWQARLQLDGVTWAQGTPLATLLAQLPILPLPETDRPEACDVPEGALLEFDRNRHALLRHLPRLAAPLTTGNGRRGGWLMLVANGAGGYWFEVAGEFREAVEVTATSLEALRDEAEYDAEANTLVEAAIARMADLQQRLRSALQGLKRVA
jgi:HrpA-like RNA helicase